MTIGFIGLGKMGAKMVERLLGAGHTVYVYDNSNEALAASCQKGAIGCKTQTDLTSSLPAPRIVWIMVPSKVTEEVLDDLLSELGPGDIIIDGGNSYYKDSMRRAKRAAQHGIHFIDAGTSGGIWGLTEGYCIMAGGDEDAFRIVKPVMEALAPGDALLYTGPSGSGHYVKMVHNGVEYGMMQSYAEGFDLLQTKQDFALDMEKIANLWRHGSVVRSWLLDLLYQQLKDDPTLASLHPWVEDSGEGRWTVQEGIESGTPLPVITAALFTRFYSRETNSFAARILAALRKAFGGHSIKGN